MLIESPLRRLLAVRHLERLALPAALVLALPALTVSWVMDDYTHFAMVSGQWHDIARAPWDLFNFFDSDPDWQAGVRASGSLPWYASDGIHAAFLRPLSSLSIWLDHTLWPGAPFLAHVHSLLWFAFFLWAGQRVLRRTLPEGVWPLAMLVFLFDDAHGIAASWIAHRNSLIAGSFAFLALDEHVRWRRGEGASHMWRSIASYSVALCGGEVAIEITPFVGAWALFREDGPWARRLAGWIPLATCTFVYLAIYSALGYGAGGSALYIDPMADPARFLVAALTRVPTLLLGIWTFIPADLTLFLGKAGEVPLAVAGLAVTLAIWFGALRHADKAQFRFWSVGMFGALVPCVGTFSNDRLLPVAGLGGAALIGTAIATALERGRERAGIRVTGSVLAIMALVVAPLSLPIDAVQVEFPARAYRWAAASMDRIAPDLTGRTVIALTSPDIFASSIASVTRFGWGTDFPAALQVVHSGIDGVTVERVDARTLRFRSHGRIMNSPFDPLVRAEDDEFEIGETHSLGATAELRVDALDADGFPTELTLTAEVDLDDTGWLWTYWTTEGYVPTLCPTAGAPLEIPAIAVTDVMALSFRRAMETRPPPRDSSTPTH